MVELSEFVVYWSGGYEKYTNIAPGESVPFEMATKSGSEYKGTYYMVEEIYPRQSFGSTSTDDNAWKGDIIRNLISINGGTSRYPIQQIQAGEYLKYFAFFEEDFSRRVKIDGKEPKNQVQAGIITGDISIKFEKDGELYIPEGVISALRRLDLEKGGDTYQSKHYIYIAGCRCIGAFDNSCRMVNLVV